MIVDNYTRNMNSPYFVNNQELPEMLRFKFKRTEAKLCIKLNILMGLKIVNLLTYKDVTYKNLTEVFNEEIQSNR